MDITIIAVVAIVLGLGGMVLIGFAIYKTLFNKKKSGNMFTPFTPYDDMTRGTNDTNSNKYLEEDTRHAVGIEETRNVE
ncbi:hypothetical protein [Sporosarcina psychrophila]|uniref:hypothetical protein n=1 Tax=Sporosarcina psychrophila TaxID=1476 RepID=UPI00078B82E6|nr:hypothetical protein [Sporosarcina psychrophila]AMQ05160.1 hypothetical protein AZE41_03965 [Sporosarcina psychrophila]